MHDELTPRSSPHRTDELSDQTIHKCRIFTVHRLKKDKAKQTEINLHRSTSSKGSKPAANCFYTLLLNSLHCRQSIYCKLHQFMINCDTSRVHYHYA